MIIKVINPKEDIEIRFYVILNDQIVFQSFLNPTMLMILDVSNMGRRIRRDKVEHVHFY